MIIPLNWLKKYVDIKIPTDELVELIGARLVEVESAVDISEKYKGIKIVEVRSAERIEDSDHLSKCQIWDGAAEYQVVCGAPNVRAGILAVWLPPKTVLPASWNEEPLVLDKRKVMGVESAGMLAAIDELDFGTDHDSIVEIDPNDAKPGDDFAEILGLNDILLDIENKSLTHRPDCFGVIGFAREVAGILGQSACDYLNNPDKNDCFAELPYGDKPELKVEIADPKLCPRYQAVVLDGFSDKPAKHLSEMAVVLAKSGMRPIDPIVDVTNYLMLLTGQPLHAFDYDKLIKVGGGKEAKIIVRAAKKGEKMDLLDGKTIEMSENDIVITSNNVPVALAGAMGGSNTAIDRDTKRIVVESATFNLYNLRGTQFRHGIFSEAITRFTKGQPPALTDPVIDECVRILTEEHGMKIVGAKVDAYPKKTKATNFEIPVKKFSRVLGKLEGRSLDRDGLGGFDVALVENTLKNLGYENVETKSLPNADNICNDTGVNSFVAQNFTGAAKAYKVISATAPWWRTDVHIAEDVIEDIGRINGFDNIEPTLPTRDFTAVGIGAMAELKDKIRSVLSAAGANEVLTYSFVHGDLLKKVGQDPANSYKITNAISPALQYVRQQLTPSLLEKIYENLKDGYDQLALFEINQAFLKDQGLTDEKVPKIFDNLALVVADKNSRTNFYDAKNYLVKLGKELGVKFDFRAVEEMSPDKNNFEPKRTAKVFLGETWVGIVGEMRASVLRNLKLPAHTAAFEISFDELVKLLSPGSVNYQPLSRYPSVERDITFQVSADLEYAKLENLISETLESVGLRFELVPVSIYQDSDKSTKNISFRLSFASMAKTLTGDEIAAIIDKIAREAADKLNAIII